MRKVLEVLRLRFDSKLGLRPIGASMGVGRTTVTDYLARFAASGLPWPLPTELDEQQLEARLFPSPQSATARVMPDMAAIDVELRRPGVTLMLLWTEYRQQHGEHGYQFSRFCGLHAEWRRKQRLWMRQPHKAGEKLFVDFSGDALKIVDAQSGAVSHVKLFVAALGASSYTFACATPDETLPSFLDCHVRAFEFFGAAPKILVPDNLRSAVTRADRHEPDVNRSYSELAEHYGACVIPARPYTPRDKAKVEVAVQVAQRWIVAVLRNRVFHSLVDLNEEIEVLLEKLNARVMRHVGQSRVQLFKEVDLPQMKPLPPNAYEYARWVSAKVHPDYHVDVDRHFYSVPHSHRGEVVMVRVTARSVEVLLHGKRIASHALSRRKWHYTTLPEHMPPHHQHVAGSTVEDLRERAAKAGPNVLLFFEELMKRRQHPEQAIKGCLGVLSLVRANGTVRVDAACRRAVRFHAISVQSIKNILANRLDGLPLDDKPQVHLPLHGNVRGSGYFH